MWSSNISIQIWYWYHACVISSREEGGPKLGITNIENSKKKKNENNLVLIRE